MLFGYLRDTSDKKETAILKDIIITVCIKYYLQKIDYFKPHYGAEIDRDNNLFAVKTNEQDEHITYCISQIGWNKGKHDMIIRILNLSHRRHGLSVGILTNPNIDTTSWLFDTEEAGNTYQFFFGRLGDPSHSGIYHKGQSVENINNVHKNVRKTQIIGNDIMNNSKIKMSVDCDEWNIAFFYDDIQIGKTIYIEPMDNYHAAIVYNTDSYRHETSEFQLLLHTRQFNHKMEQYVTANYRKRFRRISLDKDNETIRNERNSTEIKHKVNLLTILFVLRLRFAANMYKSLYTQILNT